MSEGHLKTIIVKPGKWLYYMYIKCTSFNSGKKAGTNRNEAGKTDLSAYRSVLSVCSQQLRPGDIIAIYTQYVIIKKITDDTHM